MTQYRDADPLAPTEIGALRATAGQLARRLRYLETLPLGSSAGDLLGIVWVMDGGGDTIPTGESGYLRIPFPCTITGWSLMADVAGSVVLDVWKDAAFPPVIGDTITGSEKPTLSSARSASDQALTTWVTAVAANDYLLFTVDSLTDIEKLTLVLHARRARE